MVNCTACDQCVPENPLDFNMPDRARCKRDHSVIEGCPYQPIIAKCRGNWIREVFQPLPPDEAEMLRPYLP